MAADSPRATGFGNSQLASTASETDQPSKKIKPGEFSARCKALQDQGVPINYKHIQGYEELLSKIKNEKEANVENSVPDMLCLMNDSKWTPTGSAKSTMTVRLKWQGCCNHNDLTDLLERLDAALCYAGWQQGVMGSWLQ